ncbi:peptidase [Xylariomycetidae sp. FL2044]|nr:peptidase [Xylariomycetidae sp. FL2044]
MPSALIPRALQPGGTIAFVSPSSRVNDQLRPAMTRATATLTARGYRVRELFTPDDAGVQSSIAHRVSELRAAFADPDISAVICVCGGTTFTELLPALVADAAGLRRAVRENPKIVVGYSDITGLHWLLHALTGLRTFYGPGAIPELCEPAAAYEYEASARAFCETHLFRAITSSSEPLGDVARSPTYAPDPARVFSEPASMEPPRLVPNPGWTWLRRGQGEGRLFGGCLTVMARLAGIRAVAPDWKGRIVFFETAQDDDHVSGTPIARVRAAVADLIAQGVFDDAAGLVVGRPFGYDSPEMRAQYTDAVKGLLCEGPMAEKGFPILFGVDIGHTTPMVTLPYDALAVLDSEKDRFAILEPAVSA